MLCHLLPIVLAAVTPDAVAARVGPEVISAADVANRAQRAHQAPGAALDDMVTEALLAVAARSEGMARQPAVRARIDAERRRLAAERLLELEVLAHVKVTDREISEAFHATADRVRLSMVVRATEEEARATLGRLHDGAALIDEARSSLDPVGRSKSGVLGWFTRSQLAPAVAKAAFSIPLAQPSDPVPLDKGFAVLVVHEREIGKDAALRQDASELREALQSARRGERATQFLHALRRKGDPRASDTDLLAREAARRGLGRDARVVRALRRSERTALARAYVDRIATQVDAPTEAEIQAAYSARPDDFWVPQRRRCEMLLAKTEQDAEQLRLRLMSGEPLEVVARDSARGDPERRAVDSVEVTDPELDAMAADQHDRHVLAWTIRKTPPGLWAKAETDGHWHVIRCGTPDPPHRRPFAEAKASLARSLREQRIGAAIETRVAQLRRVTPVWIDAAAVTVAPAR